VNTAKSSLLKVADTFTPVLKESKFKETGMITPDEFVIAGDHLVHHCPTWHWASVSDSSMTKSYLPKDKQYLITRSVPCYRRVKDIAYSGELEKIVEKEGDADGGWVDTHHGLGDGAMEEISEMALGGGASKPPPAKSTVVAAGDDDDDAEPAMDMDAYVEAGLLDAEDPHTLSTVKCSAGADDGHAAQNNVITTRTYDLNITYDNYYRTPRMWISGYDEKRRALTVEQMYEDFSEDHANKTVTMETHPHIPGPAMASIHPCRHAEVMKKLIDTIEENGKELGVHQYLLIFLKFVQAVIPTVEYDFTQNVQL